MGFKGQFSWITSLHQGGRKAISFTLKNTNLLKTATFDIAIVDGSNLIPTKYFRGQKLRAGQYATYDIENGAWDWAQGDFICILDSKGRQIPDLTWILRLPELAPGECKDCHGSHQCNSCGGTGRILNRYTHTYQPCTICRSTGICQTCFIPTRQNSPNSPLYMANVPGVSPSSSATNARKAEAIRAQIQELEHKVYLLEQENLNIQRNGQTLSLRSIFENNNNLIHRYKIEMLNLQNLLNSLH